MKNLKFIFLIVLLSYSRLIAQEVNADYITAKEYCAFLNTKGGHENSWIFSQYYNNSLMRTEGAWVQNKNALILRQLETDKKGTSYNYSVIKGHEDDLINMDSLSSSNQKEIEEWQSTES